MRARYLFVIPTSKIHFNFTRVPCSYVGEILVLKSGWLEKGRAGALIGGGGGDFIHSCSAQ